MKTRYKTYLIVVVIILTLFYSTLASSEAEELGVKIERNVPVPMRDGTILRADVHRPDRGGPYPVLVQRTPYGKRGGIDRFVKAGYIVVSQDARGRYESEGKFESYWQLKTHDAEDGYDTVEWAARLPGSNSKVGTFGTSYPAFLQWRLAPLRPPSLVAMSACSIPAQIWYVENPCTIRPGFRLGWLAMMAIDMRQHENLPGVHNRWELWQLWQEESRKWLYWLPWLELPQDFFGYETDIFKSWLKNPHTDPWKFDERCKDITVPNLDIVGWYDHCNGDMLLFQMMVKEAKTKVARKGSRIIIGPWSHGGTGRRYRNIDFGPNAIIDKRALQIGWFDYWLKGKQNGGSKEAPVRIFVMGDNKWRDEQHWPLQRTKEKILYITSDGHANTPNGNGRLIDEKTKSSGTDNYLYDPDNPVPTPYGARRPIPVDQRPLVKRQDILVYQTEPLTERVEVTGNPVVELYAASSAPDTDWFIRLIDVAPDGLARDASSGMVRARYRDGFDKFKLIEPNEVVKYIIRMSPTSNAFLPGHRIRLDITSSDFPNYDRNHNTPFNQNSDATLVTAKQTIFHGGERATQIILPWVPNPQETEQIQPADLAKSLFRAAANGDIEQVKLLISMGADVNVKHSNGQTPAEFAMNGNHNEVVELLISKGADISPLHFALYMKDQAKIKGLIESGADVNKRTPYGTTPLHRAVGAGFKDIVDLLIVKGADVNAKDSWAWTPLHSAVYDSKDTVELLITKGADVNARDGDGLTPLSYALATDRKDVAELLLVKGADFTSKDENARTPLHYAAQYGLKNIAEIFLARDVDVNSKKQEHGLTPLHYAASGGHQDIAELFMAKGAKVDEKDAVYEFTALHYAARFGNKDIAELLIAKGADVNAKDKWDYQPIHVAAHHDRPDVVELLISKGADINAKTSLEQTPIQLAQERRNTKTVELLRKHEAEE